MVDPVERERKLSSEAVLDGGEKSLAYIKCASVPQTDTGRQEEDSKGNGRRVVKELGKMSP